LVSDVSDGALIMALLTRGLTSFLKCFTYKLPILTPVVLLQFCRYLFYLGKIRTIQLEYTYCKLLGKPLFRHLVFEFNATSGQSLFDYC